MSDDSLKPPPRTLVSTASTAGWWSATLMTLVVIDDLTFGPVFWLISRLNSPIAGFLAALLIYLPAQILLVREATTNQPRRLAAWMLGRLDLERRSAHVADRERRLRQRVTGALAATALAMAIGGVLPALLLWRAGYSRTFVRRLSVLTALVYSVEFSLLHGLLPGLI